MNLSIFICIIAVIALLLYLGFKWKATYWPLQTWKDSIAVTLSEIINPEGQENPFYEWFKDNKMGMGGHGTIELDHITKNILDTITTKLKEEWQYVADIKDPTTGRVIDWEPVKKDQRKGDCEDFARVLAMLLIDEFNHRDQPFDPACMTYGMGALGGVALHATLIMNTTKGTYAADCYNRYFMPWKIMDMQQWYFADADGFYHWAT